MMQENVSRHVFTMAIMQIFGWHTKHKMESCSYATVIKVSSRFTVHVLLARLVVASLHRKHLKTI